MYKIALFTFPIFLLPFLIPFFLLLSSNNPTVLAFSFRHANFNAWNSKNRRSAPREDSQFSLQFENVVPSLEKVGEASLLDRGEPGEKSASWKGRQSGNGARKVAGEPASMHYRDGQVQPAQQCSRALSFRSRLLVRVRARRIIREMLPVRFSRGRKKKKKKKEKWERMLRRKGKEGVKGGGIVGRKALGSYRWTDVVPALFFLYCLWRNINPSVLSRWDEGLACTRACKF